MAAPAKQSKGKGKGKCAHAASHRRAQAKYVAGNKDKHAAAVKRHQRKNRDEINAKKRRTRKRAKRDGHKAGGGKPGRPREC